jgi:ATP-dependent RNA helicase HelY
MSEAHTLSPAERFAAAKNRQRHPLTSNFMEGYEFPLDDFQRLGCQHLEDGKSVLIAAPTGAGKTIIGEFATYLAERHGKRCFYTTPIKALSNQKYQDLVKMFGESEVGLLTGDSSVNSSARIVVMTTEVLRNMIYSDSDAIADLGYVVMDEVHYLADKFRGAVWEEILIHLPDRIQVVSLSATVSNAEEFGEWLKTVRGETEVVLSEIRPVPLYQHILIGNRLLDLFVDDGRVNPELVRLERNSARRIPGGERLGSNRGWQQKSYSVIKSLSRPEVVEKLREREFLPVIYFIFSRAGCDAAVTQCIREGISLTNSEEKEQIRSVIARRTSELSTEDFGVLGFYEWCQALERGIAAHHAGLLPMFKETIEELFQLGLLKVVFATETLALGINMPARTVLLEKLVKWNGESHAQISPGEYTQLTGRAGRRGIDIEGNAVVMWSEQIDSSMAAGLASTRTYPLKSSFSPTYNMTANLIDRFGRERARKSLGASFAQFQADKAVVGLARQIEKNNLTINSLRGDATCHLGDMDDYMDHRFSIKELEASFSARRISGNRRKAHAAIDEEISEHRRYLKSHPCHQCPDRESHARNFEKAARLERESQGLSNRMESRTNVIPRTFDRVGAVLTELDYLRGDSLTPQGVLLTKLYAESDLLLAELVNSNLFDDIGPSELVSILSSLIYEGRGERSRSPRLPKTVEALVPEVARIWSRIVLLEESHGITPQSEPNFDLAWSAFRWANGYGLQTILRETEITVGDFIRCIRQIIDLLGQLLDANPDMHALVRDAMKRIDRGVIAYAAVIA